MDYRLPPTLAILRRTVIVAVILAVAVGAWSVYWLVLATSLRDGAIAWAEQRRAEGPEVGFANLEVDGYPNSVRAVIDRPTARPSDRAWSWSADRAELTLNPLTPKHFTVAVTGRQAVDFQSETGRISYAGTAQAFTAEMVDDATEPWGTLSVRDLAMTEVGGSEAIAIGRLDADAKGYAASPGAAGAPTFELSLSLADVQLPRDLMLPLGQRVAAAAIEAKVLGTLAPGPLPDALARWRDAGGTVEVARLDVEYGPLDLNANGTLALDGDNQPIGAFTTRIRGFFQVVDALRRRRLVDDRAAITAKLVLGALARKGSNGERPTLSIPLTLQDRLLYAGSVPLFEIPPISWTTDP